MVCVAALALACFVGAGCRPTEHLGDGICTGCNIVLVSIDTLRADRTTPYGYRKPTTPELARFAARSLVYENPVTQSSWTRPSHLTMFTGLFPAEHGTVATFDPRPAGLDVSTLPGILSRRGYHTAGFHGGGNMDAHFEIGRGFSIWRSGGPYLRYAVREGLAWLDGSGAQPAGSNSAQRQDAGIAEPFFLFLHGYDPHDPYPSRGEDRVALGVRAGRWRRALKTCRGETPGGRKAPRPGAMERLSARYDASVRMADAAFGNLLRELEDRGLAERTVVLLTSDHGEEFGEHGGCMYGRTLHREVLRVPFVLHLPGRGAGRVPGAIPASAGLAATLLEAVGILDHPLPGGSVLPANSGSGSRPEGFRFAGPTDPVVSETASRVRGRSLALRSSTSAREKFIRRSDSKTLYYRIGSHPMEKTPVDSPLDDARLARELEEWARRHPALPRQGAGAMMPTWLKERLRELGYLAPDDPAVVAPGE